MTAARSASVVEPVMVGGRVWGTSAIMAPNVTTIAASTAVATSVMASLKVSPEQVGFDPFDQHEIAGLVGQRQDVDPVMGQSMTRRPSSAMRISGRRSLKSKKGRRR